MGRLVEDPEMTGLDDVEAVTFDSYSTLVDVGTTVTALAEYVDDPVPVARTWRLRSLLYALICNDLGTYAPFSALVTDALEYALREAGTDLDQADRTDLLAVYDDLESFPDVRPGIERLVDGGRACYVISNGDPAMLESMLETADITDLIVDTISADDVERYKPAPAIYEAAIDKVGLAPDRIAHASAGFFDVYGAMNAGIHGVWLNRHERPADPFGPTPDRELATIHALADELGLPPDAA